MASKIPKEHWNYDELDDPDSPCRCVLCERRRDTALLASAMPTPDGHGAFRCKCVACRTKRKADEAAIEAFNRHSVYSELTWAARGHAWTNRFLDWTWRRLTNPEWHPVAPHVKRPTVSWWWVRIAERKTISSWLEDWAMDDDQVLSAASADRLLRGTADAAKQFARRR